VEKQQDDMDDDDDEVMIIENSHASSDQQQPVVDVLQIDNELSTPKYRFEKNEICLCYHGLLLYETKCIDHKMKHNFSGRTYYLVHYCGWSTKWDEWVEEERLVKWDSAGLKKQQDLLTQHGKGKARLKNLRKNTPAPTVGKRTTSRSISDFSTTTTTTTINVDLLSQSLASPFDGTNNETMNNDNETTPSVSGRSDAN